MNPIPAQANIRCADLVARASGAPITAGTVNLYIVALTGANAGQWFRDSDDTWQAAEAVADAMTHKADGHWSVSVAAACWIDGVEYLQYAKESGDLHIPVSEHYRCSAIPAIAGSAMTLADDAITLSKFDETTAWPLVAADAGATQVARVGADSDTLETLSDEIAAVHAKTTNLPASPAAVGSEMDLVDAPNATAITAIQAGLAATGEAAAAVATLENLSAADAAAAVLAADSITTTGVVTFAEMLAALYAMARGKIVKTGDAYAFLDDDDTTTLFTLTIADGERTTA